MKKIAYALFIGAIILGLAPFLASADHTAEHTLQQFIEQIGGLSGISDTSFASTTGSTALFSFSLKNGGNKSVQAGQIISNTIIATPVSGTKGVLFSVEGLPDGTTGQFSPGILCTTTPCSVTLNIKTSSYTPNGTYTIRVAAKEYDVAVVSGFASGDASGLTLFTLTVSGSTDSSGSGDNTGTIGGTPGGGGASCNSETVVGKFKLGDRVRVSIDSLSVRSFPSTSPESKIGTQAYHAMGTIACPPAGSNYPIPPATVSGYTWWYINYDASPDGWSAEGSSIESYLEKISIAIIPPPSPACLAPITSTCTDWSVCTNGVQTRVCTITDICNNSVKKTEEKQNCTALPPPPPPTFFSWSSAGPISGKVCTQILEVADPDTWDDNYFCADKDVGMQWSSSAPVGGMKCTYIQEVADPNTWNDNYLCLPSDSPFNFAWSSSEPTGLPNNVQWYESADPHTWDDNWLGWSYTAPAVTPPPPPPPPPLPVISTKFKIGDRVRTLDTINVRSCASVNCASFGTQAARLLGTIAAAPSSSNYQSPHYADGYWWWYVDYDASPDGWSVENYLEKVAPTPCPIMSPPSSDYCTYGTVIPKYDANKCVVGYECKTGLAITTASVPNATVGTRYAMNISATGGNSSFYSWGITSGSLPPGLILGEVASQCIAPINTSSGASLLLSQTASVCTISALISGTPTMAGTYTFTVTVKDGTNSASKQFTMTVNPATVSAEYVTLHSVGIEGTNVRVKYSKNFDTCAHLQTATHVLVYQQNIFCTKGTNVEVIQPLSMFTADMKAGAKLMLCHGNNANICSSLVEVTGGVVAPSIIVISPNGGEKWVFGTPQTIKYSAPSGSTDIGVVMIEQGAVPTYWTVANQLPNTGEFVWNGSTFIYGRSLPPGTYKVQVSARLNGISILDVSDSTFEFTSSVPLKFQTGDKVIASAVSLGGSSLNVRSGPGTTFSIVATIPNDSLGAVSYPINTQFNVPFRDSTGAWWWYIKFDGGTAPGPVGWVREDLLEKMTSSLPTVTITAANSVSVEGNLDATATITLSRTGSTASTLRVSLNFSGTASHDAGTDYILSPTYQAVGSLVSIPAGASTVTLSIIPRDDVVIEPLETVIFTLNSSNEYIVGSPNSASVTIEDNDGIIAPLMITTTSLPSGTVGTPYFAKITATGGSGSYSWSSTRSAPPELYSNCNGPTVYDSSLDRLLTVFGLISMAQAQTSGNTCFISGTPTTTGTYTFTVTVKDGTSSASKQFTIVVNPATTVQQPTITVLSPNGGESIEQNSAYKITYSTKGFDFLNSPKLHVERYLKKGGQYIGNIFGGGGYDNNNGTGYVTWEGLKYVNLTNTAVATTTPGDGYSVAMGVYDEDVVRSTLGFFSVLARDIAGKENQLFKAFDESDAPFSVKSSVTIKPSITVISPNGGESWQAGTNQVIRWSASNVPSGTRVYMDLKALNSDGSLSGAGYTIASDILAVDGQFQWVVSKVISPPGMTITPPPGKYKIIVGCLPDPNVCSDLSDAPFTIATSISIKFQTGDRVSALDTLNVRSCPTTSCGSLGTQVIHALGTIATAPSNSNYQSPHSADGYNWWYVDYDVAPDGWSVENFLEKSTVSTNAPPVINAPATSATSEEKLLSLKISATDINGGILTMTAAPLPAGAEFWALGDTTMNATLSSLDATRVLQYISDPITYPLTLKQKILADVNQDGLITSADADLILNIVVGNKPSPNIYFFIWTPTSSQAGTYSVVFTATDTGGLKGSGTTVITVADITPLTITTTTLPPGTVGTSYSAQILASGGSDSYNWSVSSGFPPHGLQLSTVACFAAPCMTPWNITGTPTQAGTYTFIATVTSGTQTASRQFTINIAASVPSPSPLYRFYDSGSGDHFYTMSNQEKDQVAQAGWRYEGIAGYMYTIQQPNTLPLYRLYSSSGGDHLYTMNAEERDSIQSGGWTYEGVAGYLFASQQANTHPLYRLYHSGSIDHFYTMDVSEKDSIQSGGWAYEGVAGYLFSAP